MDRSLGSCGNCQLSERHSEQYQVLGFLPAEAREIVFDAFITRAEDSAADWGDVLKRAIEKSHLERTVDGGDILWIGKLHLAIEVVNSIDAAIPPVHDAELDASVEHSIRVGFQPSDSAPTRGMSGYVTIDVDTARTPRLAETGLSLEIDLEHDGQVVQMSTWNPFDDQGCFVWHSRTSGGVRCAGQLEFHRMPAALRLAAPYLARWSLRVRGVSKNAEYLWDAKTRWDGVAMIPLADAMQREAQWIASGSPH